MPIYEYQCKACGHQLEALQKVSDVALTDCPACHQATLSKLVSATSFQLKGTGWYVTDFRDKGKKEPSASVAKPEGEKKAGESSATTTEVSGQKAGDKTKTDSSSGSGSSSNNSSSSTAAT
ncbi:MAG: hypothetical protein A3E83_01325 [Gammaproteobacteria bacterium RIFCSPHIGHO2_12_FULL_41_20]|nr:MAG: hypothetical protein A3E83_01325 [Gammaproteobacteria bacterium RIFCSPHIGHO2_12_FULL_41_20]